MAQGSLVQGVQKPVFQVSEYVNIAADGGEGGASGTHMELVDVRVHPVGTARRKCMSHF